MRTWANGSKVALEGDYMAGTSFEWCTRSQEVDLIAAGFSAAFLDSAPDLHASEWLTEVSIPDAYYVRFELRDADHNVIDWWEEAGTTPGDDSCGAINDTCQYDDDVWFTAVVK